MDALILAKLYLIEILHQTTTQRQSILSRHGCILSKFYIKPQQWDRLFKMSVCCILSKFYIKPQLLACYLGSHFGCILSKFYIKPQQSLSCICWKTVVSYRNSTSNHNYNSCTKPRSRLYLIEILHQTTTCLYYGTLSVALYLIEILHQTTTPYNRTRDELLLYLIEILHQTTTNSTSITVG